MPESNQIHLNTSIDPDLIDTRADALGFNTRTAYLNHLIRQDLLESGAL